MFNLGLKTKANLDKKALSGILAKFYNANIVITVEETDGRNNTEIAAIHEFGSMTRNIPRRSFLIDPINIKKDRLNKFVSKFLFVIPYIKSSVAELVKDEMANIIDDAFETKGFGTWQELKPKTIKRKGHDMPLIDSGKLRKSIKVRVEKKR